MVPQNGLFIMETPIKMDDSGGTHICHIFGNTHVFRLGDASGKIKVNLSANWNMCCK